MQLHELMKVLFVRPPRYYWPFTSETSSFWQPLGMLSIAAVLREHDIEVEILDCCILKIGWRTLARVLEGKKFDVLAIGEEVCSAHEGLKAAKLAKNFHPECVVVAGGYYFTHIFDDLKTGIIDYIVRFEGEETMLELLQELQKKKPELKKVKGVAYFDKIG